MRCAHCGVHHYEYHARNSIMFGSGKFTEWSVWTSLCPECKGYSLFFGTGDSVVESRLIYPHISFRRPVSKNVPNPLLADYTEACAVLPMSPKASAALARRCLQNILSTQGYSNSNLSKQIDSLLNEQDPKKAIGSTLAATVDAIRNFGNFSAHPIDDKTTLQIIEVEPEEAEWCLEILEEIFDHFYEKPAIAAAKKAALDAKLMAAGKPITK